MHDWTLISVQFKWKAGRVVLSFRTPEAEVSSLVAEGVFDLHVPQKKDWGPSVSVNEIRGPSGNMSGRQKLEIEMQSGDVIEIEAVSFEFPTPTVQPVGRNSAA
jgi:hypothetical protein